MIAEEIAQLARIQQKMHAHTVIQPARPQARGWAVQVAEVTLKRAELGGGSVNP